MLSMVLQCSNVHTRIYIMHDLYLCLGKKADTAPVEGTENEGSTDHANGQGAADQGGRRRAANQNRGLRAQLQASRRARLARISEDENDGMLRITYSCYILYYPHIIHSYIII